MLVDIGILLEFVSGWKEVEDRLEDYERKAVERLEKVAKYEL